MSSRCTESSFGRFLTEFKNSPSKEHKCTSMRGSFYCFGKNITGEISKRPLFKRHLHSMCFYKKIISPSWLKWQSYFEKTDCVCTCVCVQKYPRATIVLEFLCHDKKDQPIRTHNSDQSKQNFSLSLMTFSTMHKTTRKPLRGIEIRHIMKFYTDVLSIELTTQRTF